MTSTGNPAALTNATEATMTTTPTILSLDEAAAALATYGPTAGVILVTIVNGERVTDTPTICRIGKVANVYGNILADLAAYRTDGSWAIPLEAQDLPGYEPRS
jgi:hypothetical protein